MTQHKTPRWGQVIRNNIGLSLISASVILTIFSTATLIGTPLLMAALGGLETNSPSATFTAVVMIVSFAVLTIASFTFPAGVVVFIVEEVTKRRKIEAQQRFTPSEYGDTYPRQ